MSVPTIVFGPHGENWHQCNEWVNLPSIVSCAQVVLETVKAFSNE